jgi:hypothetical protein
MAKAAQDGLDEQNRAVEACRAGVKHDHQQNMPHDTGSEYGETSESSSGETEPARRVNDADTFC